MSLENILTTSLFNIGLIKVLIAVLYFIGIGNQTKKINRSLEDNQERRDKLKVLKVALEEFV